MNQDYTVSVIIPTYNRETVLRRSVISVLEQTHPPQEIIVVDDGSTDGTEQLISNEFPQVQYLKQENRGISAARNTGISHAVSKWIAFLDSDDEWLPKKLEEQINALIRQPSINICHTNEIWIRRGRRVNPKNKHQKSGGDIFNKCLPFCVISPSSVVINSDLFQTYGMFDSSLPVCEDYDMWLRLCAYLPVLYIEQPLIIKYGGHSDQLSAAYWGLDRFRIHALEKIISDPDLAPDKRDAAIDIILNKIDIYLKGLKKRKKIRELADYSEKKKKFQAVHKALYSI
jgi:glycosyltransferase involved in cell wall biosynthesis